MGCGECVDPKDCRVELCYVQNNAAAAGGANKPQGRAGFSEVSRVCVAFLYCILEGKCPRFDVDPTYLPLSIHHNCTLDSRVITSRKQ